MSSPETKRLKKKELMGGRVKHGCLQMTSMAPQRLWSQANLSTLNYAWNWSPGRLTFEMWQSAASLPREGRRLRGVTSARIGRNVRLD